MAGTALLAGLLQGVGATASQAAPRTVDKTGTGSRTAALTLDKLSPAIPAKGDSITVAGSVVNNGRTTITGARIAVHINGHGPLRSRSAMESAAADTGYSASTDGYEINGHTVQVADLAPGHSAAFTITFPVSALFLGASGVYPVGVSLDGQDAAEPWSHVLGIKRTFLPWYPDGESAKSTKISFLWPLTDVPHVDPRGDTASQESPIFRDDGLVRELQSGNGSATSGGRLWQMVELGKQLPITWVIDPDLLATVEAMTKPYRVEGHGGDVTHTTPGTGSAVAEKWLNELKGAVGGAQVIALPFGDPDIASLAHHGKGINSNLRLVQTGEQLGKTTVDTILGTQSTTGVAWPVDGAIDPSIVSTARTTGAKTVIARSDSLRESPTLSYTPNAARPIGGGSTAVVADATLSTAFDGDMSKPQNALLAVQNYIAQTLLVTMESPDTQRDILVAPERMPTAAQAHAMATAINATDTTPWAESVDFSSTAKATPDPQASRHVPASSAYPRSLRAQELPAEAFRQLHEVQVHLNNFVTILTIKDRVTVPFRNSMLRAMSTGWRGNSKGETAYRNAIGAYLTDLINAVHILSKSDLTLSGRSGTIPVTVKNDLGQPITGLVLKLGSNSSIRLKIKNAERPISIDGGHTRTLKFETTASANGLAQVTAQLYTQQGALYGETVSFNVELTNVTDLVMLIIAAGLLLLVLAGVRIYRQRKRHAAGGGADGGDGEGGDGTGSDGGDDNGDQNGDEDEDGADPGHPGDPGTDTGQETREPSPAGEKVDG
ncbi:DUF6049 family protein [Actinacidiphila yeochonensis]|uniref:DUF6049 family protein n=1 Tax=Actinacidiphila yeochonensis TaxID=89050 RepID=UPI000A57DD5D|nr:DUF6049 family protein [Actinacidiphila yeochonensis]